MDRDHRPGAHAAAMMGQDDFTFVSDPAQIDLDAAYRLLIDTHWAASLSFEVLRRAAEHSLCFAVLSGEKLVGFARVITDQATYAYLTDVVVDPEYRGRGVGLWFMGRVLDVPELKGLRRITLLTRDAEHLYRRLGFEQGAGPLVYMERRP
jgi:N-acetylglutamate synthase-like GNAT family acetyltransferase